MTSCTTANDPTNTATSILLMSGQWKLMSLQNPGSPIPGSGGIPGKSRRMSIGLSLLDLETDVGETINVADAHLDVVARLTAYAESMRRELGDGRDHSGTSHRPIGQ